MEGAARSKLWMKVKQRLGLQGTGFCGSSQSLRASNIQFRGGGEEEEVAISGGVGPIPVERSSAPPSACQIPARPGMNLATALAAERNQRPAGPTRSAAVAPLKSLMRLFDETDGADASGKKKREAEEEGIDAVCCVCIERNKGAAFIPCGHTFCRVCCIELWLSRASCPLCNRLISDILHLF